MTAPAPSPGVDAPTPPRSALGAAGPVADPDRRLHAFLLDRLIGWGLVGLAGVPAYRSSAVGGAGWTAPGVVVGALLLVGLASGLLLGRRGWTPGRAVAGLRVVSADDGRPIGAGPGVLRACVLGMATVPTCGLGVAALARSALTDRHRRGWHDHLVGSVVVDVREPRSAREPIEEVPEDPGQIVNLTAARLAVPEQPRALPPRAPVVRYAEAVAPGGWRVSFDTGQTVRVDGPLLVGRSPQPRPGETGHEVLPLASSDLSLSRTHVEVRAARDGALVVTDRGSTNGSVLVRGGVPRELPAGRPTTLLAGDVVHLGDRRMTVTREGTG